MAIYSCMAHISMNKFQRLVEQKAPPKVFWEAVANELSGYQKSLDAEALQIDAQFRYILKGTSNAYPLSS